MKSIKIGCVVPAYNEEPRINSVLNIVTTYGFDKIIVVDDGSKDKTLEASSKFTVETIRHETNLGKGAAMQNGILQMKDMDIIVFLDADLIGLNLGHIDSLINPLLQEKQPAMTIGVFKDKRKKSVDLAQNFFSILNGQRAINKEFVQILPELTWSRFGIELLLTKFAKYSNSKVYYPTLENISHYTKEEKLGFIKGVNFRMQMYKEVLYALFVYSSKIKIKGPFKDNSNN